MLRKIIAAVTRPLRRTPEVPEIGEDALMELHYALADAGLCVVAYTGNRIAVTDTVEVDYPKALSIARRAVAERGLPVTVLDSPLY